MIIDHIALRAEDIHKVAKWYQDTIGAEVTHQDKYYIRLTTNNTTIAIIDMNRYPKNHIGILVGSLEELPKDGARVEHRDGTVGVYCEDPEGNFIEFIYYTEELRPQFVTYGHTKTDS